MKNTPELVPTIIEHLNPVTEQFGPLSHDSDQMQVPEAIEDVPSFVYELLTQVEKTLLETPGGQVVNATTHTKKGDTVESK